MVLNIFHAKNDLFRQYNYNIKPNCKHTFVARNIYAQQTICLHFTNLSNLAFNRHHPKHRPLGIKLNLKKQVQPLLHLLMVVIVFGSCILTSELENAGIS